MIDAAEIMIDEPMSMKAQRFMKAMAASAPRGSVVTRSYGGRHRILMMYGPGAERKLPLIARHMARGGRVAAWDLGYWDRPRCMRLSIDNLHPTPGQLARSDSMPARQEFVLREDADEAGPIMLIGLGVKSVYAYSLGRALKWESTKLAELRLRFPGRKIVWRPKGKYAIPLSGDVPLRHGMPIDEALRGCSMVVCRHSNVAIDACIAGVPAECEAGAAHALYRHGSKPDATQRAEFLRRLAWWQWAGDEAKQAWLWINHVTRGEIKAVA